ncbi:MAG: SLC45 family MFS transporter [Oscillatoria sp. SIO1A7]|nr:SLC45 family MFS transporter [Oscillatoria sp. SIO1A7]
MNKSSGTDAIAPPQSQNILWRKVWALTALQGTITLSWVFYKLYLKSLLVDFGLPENMAAGILLLEDALAVVIEPLMGGLSDGSMRWMGTRFPFISAGVILSSALFVSIPTLTTFVEPEPDSWVRWLLPGLLVMWSLAMTVFRSPALTLLGKYASPRNLPKASSLLTLVGGIIVAIAPISNQFILGLGPGPTFTIASISMLGTAAVLRAVDATETTASGSSNESSNLEEPPIAQEADKPVAAQPKHLFLALALIFVTSITLSWGSGFLMETLKSLIAELGGNVQWLTFAVAIALALTAVPAGYWAERLGNRLAMLIGIGPCMGLLLLMGFVPNGAIFAIAAIGLVAFFNLVRNGGLPLAISLVPPQRIGLAIGIYTAGIKAAGILKGTAFSPFGEMNLVKGAIAGSIAFVAASSFIAASRLVQPADSV